MNVATLTPAGAPPSAPLYPAYLAHLVDRAATLLRLQGLGQVVAFTYVADGEEVPYTAKLEWPTLSRDNAARVVVSNRFGDFVCQSLPGDWFNIDSVVWCLSAEPDDADRDALQRAHQSVRRVARSQ